MMKHCPESKNYSPVPNPCQEPRECGWGDELVLMKAAETSRDAVMKLNLTSVVGNGPIDDHLLDGWGWGLRGYGSGRIMHLLTVSGL